MWQPYIWIYIHTHIFICISYYMGKRDLADVYAYALGPGALGSLSLSLSLYIYIYMYTYTYNIYTCIYIYVYIYVYIYILCISYYMGMNALPDMYARSPRAEGIHIRQSTSAHVITNMLHFWHS